MSAALGMEFSPVAEAYLNEEERSLQKRELLNGSIISMAGGTPLHSLVAMNFSAAIHRALSGRPCRVFNSDLRVRKATSDTFLYPDVTIICGKPVTDSRDNVLNPTVIIEVTSPSTENYDRNEKREHYFQITSLQEYIIVAPNRPYIEQYIRQNEFQWLLQIYASPDASVVLPSIDINIGIAEIYENADFAA